MDQIGKTLLAEDGNSDERIGDKNRSEFADKALKFEKLSRLSPLPSTFDVGAIHPPYFTEFNYTDCMGGMLFGTLSAEVNARLLQKCFDETKLTYCYIDAFKDSIEDKYVLKECTGNNYKSVVFPPGSNKIGIVDRNILDRAMYDNQNMLIKPHPITNRETLRNFGVSYGYARILELDLSGIQILLECEEVFTTSASETGIICAAFKIPFKDITVQRMSHNNAYSSIYRLFKDWDVEHNYKVVNALLEGTSGFIFDFHTDPETRAKALFSTAMEIREVFKPSYPQLEFEYPTEFEAK